jgi:hypothetical protein
MVNDRGIWVHQGVPQGEVDFAKVIRENREERLKRLGGME